MLTREEIYGGSRELEYTTPSETLSIAEHSDVRVWTLTSVDMASPTLTLNLPPIESLRPAGGWNHRPGIGAAGGLVYLIVNETVLLDVDVRDSDNNLIANLATGEALMLHIDYPDKDQLVGGADPYWIHVKKAIPFVLVGVTTHTINFGDFEGSSNNARSYSYEADAWTSKPGFPIPGGTPATATAGDRLDLGTPEETLTYLTYQVGFFRWNPAGSYTTLQNPSWVALHSGLADSSGGLFGFSNMGDLLKISNAAATTARKIEHYDIVGNAWTTAPDYPANLDPPQQSVVCDIGFEGAADIYSSATTPDSAIGWLEIKLILVTYVVTRQPTWPWGHVAPSVVGLNATDLHVQNGGIDASSLSNEAASTNNHQVYIRATDTWSQDTPSPVSALGMGCRGTRLYRDRYTFGMGADGVSTPFEVHYEFNTTTRSYRARAATTWGDSSRREGSWARTDSM